MTVGSPERREKIYLQIGLQQALFTKADVDQARPAARQSRRPLGEVLVEIGALDQEQHRGLERAVTYRLGRDEDKRIAQIMVDSGYTEQAAVEQALKRQKDFYGKTGELIRIGTLLIEGGELSDSQHTAACKIYQIERGT